MIINDKEDRAGYAVQDLETHWRELVLKVVGAKVVW